MGDFFVRTGGVEAMPSSSSYMSRRGRGESWRYGLNISEDTSKRHKKTAFVERSLLARGVGLGRGRRLISPGKKRGEQKKVYKCI